LLAATAGLVFLVCPGGAGATGWRVAPSPISGPVRLASGCQTTHHANTAQIAVDPTNARHLAATYAIGFSASALAISHDGGKTWKRSPISGTLICDGGGGVFSDGFDPDLEFDPQGRLYLSASVQNPLFYSGTAGIDVLSLTVAPGSDTLGPAVPPVPTDPLMGAQRGFFAFDPAAPSTADALTTRIKYVDGQYKETQHPSLQLSRTVNAGVSYATTSVYSPPPHTGLRGQALIRHGHDLLAFADLFAISQGANFRESQIMLRSSDLGTTWSSPAKLFDHTVGADHVSDCCLMRATSGPDGTIYIPDPGGGKLQLVRSRDGGRSWQHLTVGNFGDVGEPSVAAGPGGAVAVAFYELSHTKAGLMAAVRIAVSSNHGRSWKQLSVGKPFSIRSLGPRDDTSPLGPTQGIAATPTGFVAAMTVGGSLVHAGGGSDVDLLTITK
jgi:hypothetical protein